MNPIHVIEIINPTAKSGQRKDGKGDWSMALVKLSNDSQATIFNPIQIGDVVEEIEKNGYKNWQKVKVDPKHDEMIKYLKYIAKTLTDLDQAIRSQHNVFKSTNVATDNTFEPDSYNEQPIS